MKNKFLYFLLLPLLLLTGACNMQQDIEIVLPPHEPQLVVECYLEPGLPYRLSVLETASYFDAPQVPAVADARAFITYKGRRTELAFRPTFDERFTKFYTHSSSEVMTGKPGDTYTLEVIDSKGRRVTGTTTILEKVPFDTIEWRYNSKNEALLLTSFQDDPQRTNFYRYTINRDSLENITQRDIVADDDFTNGQRITFGGAYRYEKGDTLVVTLYHIEKQYHDFLNAISNARNSSGNPFGQPSRVRSPLTGGIGIFTNLAYDRKTVILD